MIHFLQASNVNTHIINLYMTELLPGCW